VGRELRHAGGAHFTQGDNDTTATLMAPISCLAASGERGRGALGAIGGAEPARCC